MQQLLIKNLINLYTGHEFIRRAMRKSVNFSTHFKRTQRSLLKSYYSPFPYAHVRSSTSTTKMNLSRLDIRLHLFHNMSVVSDRTFVANNTNLKFKLHL